MHALCVCHSARLLTLWLCGLRTLGLAHAEQQMTPIEFVDESGKVKQLKMEERDFRAVVGLLRVAEAQEPGQGN